MPDDDWALDQYVPDGFRDEDGVWHDGPLRIKATLALSEVNDALEQAERERDEARHEREELRKRYLALVAELEQAERRIKTLERELNVKPSWSWRIVLCRWLGHKPSHTAPVGAPMDFCARCGIGFKRVSK